MSEDCRGAKEICKLIGVSCFRTAKKKIQLLEKRTSMVLLEYEDNRPVVSISAYRTARMRVADKNNSSM